MRTQRRNRRGALTAEMAITVPILFLLVFASLEFCGANNIRHTVDNAAYEGARRGIVPGATVADVQATAQSIMAAVAARNVTVNVTPSPIRINDMEITVTVTAPMRGNGWITPIFFSEADVIVGQCRMLREEL